MLIVILNVNFPCPIKIYRLNEAEVYRFRPRKPAYVMSKFLIASPDVSESYCLIEDIVANKNFAVFAFQRRCHEFYGFLMISIITFLAAMSAEVSISRLIDVLIYVPIDVFGRVGNAPVEWFFEHG